MSSSITPTPAAPKIPPSPQATLADLVALAEKHAAEQLTATVNRMVAALLDLSAPDTDPAGARQRIKSGNLLKANSYAFFHLASTGVGLALRGEAAQLSPAASATRPVAAATLALVPMEEMDEKIAFAAITRPFDIAHSEQIATLGVRLGQLLGRGMLRADQNPFRPEVFLVALHDAWREFEPDSDGHGLIVPLLRQDILFDLAPLYEALNLALVRKGQGEGSRFQKTDGAAAARAAKANREAALARQLRQLFGSEIAASDDAVPLIPDLPAMPQGSGGWRPSAAIGFGAPGGAGQTVAVTSGPMAAAPGFGQKSGPAAVAHAGFTGACPAAGQAASPGVADGSSLAMHARAAVPVSGGATGYDPSIAGPAAAGHTPVGPLLELLNRLQPGSVPGAALQGGEPGAATPHNVFYLPRLKQSLPKGSLTRSDESTLDLLSRIFETVILDDAIPAQTRELIQSLQIPVLKAALRDKNFFFEEAHPARRMLDLMSNIGSERRGQDDPLYQAMRRSVDRVGSDPQGEPESFARAVAELETSISAEEQAAEAAIAEPISKALKQERQAVATRSARQAVALRLGGGEVVAVVGAFLENRWTTVLTLAYTIEDDKPGAVENATRTMDDLIWSVKPKATQEQRRALIARLPGLLTTLNKWLDAIKWQDAERLQFFARLAECHASIVRAPIEASPERQLELAVEAAQQDALRRVAQENAVARQAEPGDKDEVELAVEGLERGTWLEFAQPDGERRKLKLAWVSPLRSLFIFSAGARGKAFSMPAGRLVEALRAGKASIASREGVVGRVLSQALQEGAVNDDDGAVRAA
jgi:hypothetical protein